MNRRTGLLRYLLLFLLSCYWIGNACLSASFDQVIISDNQAPHYFIRTQDSSNQSLIMKMKQKPIQHLEKSVIDFHPHKPWTLYLLIESSQWISSTQLNDVILNLLEKLEVPPESIETYSFQTTIAKVDTDWNIPIFPVESPNQNVALTDSLQRMNQIISKEQRNSLLCVVGSGHNTGNLTHFPLPVCPVWLIFPNEAESKHTPFLQTLVSLSGGQILLFRTVDEAEIILLPEEQKGSIIHFWIPYQWGNFRHRIQVEILGAGIRQNLVFTYPTPWLSLSVILLILLLVLLFLFHPFQSCKSPSKKADPHNYHLAWLEWKDKSAEKHHQRIHLCSFTIGSNRNCHLPLQEDSISDYHALIQEKEKGYVITDLTSRTGVWVNQQKISCSELIDGDQIQIGNIILTFRQSHIKYESNEKFL